MIFILLLLLIAYTVKINKKIERQHKIDKISFKEAIDLVNMPIVTFQNCGTKLNFVLDTGASSSVIDSDILENCKYINRNKGANLSGIDGKFNKFPMILMKISYKNKIYLEEFVAADIKKAKDNIKKESGITIHGFLGTSFFTRYKYILDYDELIAYSKECYKELTKK